MRIKISLPLSTIDHRPSTIDHRPSTIDHRPSTIDHRLAISGDLVRCPGIRAWLDRNVTEFEAANDDLKKVCVTWPSRPIFQAMADLDTHPPAAIAHWRPAQQQAAFRSFEFGLTCESARLFIARRVEKPLSEGWKYVAEPQSKDKSRRGPVSS